MVASTGAPATAGPAVALAGSAVVPVLVLAATQPPVDPKVALPLAAVDRGGVSRADVMPAGVYLGDGPRRRRLVRGLPASAAAFDNWLGALDARAGRRERDAEHDAAVAEAMQGVFWVLAVLAYACLGLAMMSLLPAASEVVGGSRRTWSLAFAGAGMIAAAAAWWIARRMGLLSTTSAPVGAASGTQR